MKLDLRRGRLRGVAAGVRGALPQAATLRCRERLFYIYGKTEIFLKSNRITKKYPLRE
ncbi:hypothetical protein [Paraburkholderia sp. HP33-1]|uniref:hypothetical protein n=1 Tax=Paraburkholderia sp. HP33-1 TaxID=2883243 RepID=UPI001F2120F5|nr:hypothetical protein [Paraburkholderia sp. HP33-1]